MRSNSVMLFGRIFIFMKWVVDVVGEVAIITFL